MNNWFTYQWLLVVATSLLFIYISPLSRRPCGFFSGTSKHQLPPGFILLTASLIISWIFAKSITNAANLGLSFGIVGGLAYSTYYLSFLVAGLIIYFLRTRGHFSSIPHFIESRFGRTALLLFALLIAIRLLNEVWSNTMVIGTYFGPKSSLPYTAAVLVFTILTLIYALKGGLRSSILTDLIQMIFFGVLLLILLGFIFPQPEGDPRQLLQQGEWSTAGGVNLLLAALLQVFSYPFHDPVMTDRGFISSPSTTLYSFITAAIVGSTFIFLFSLIGIYGQQIGVEGQAAVEVAQTFGMIVMLMMNFIMITSAASTLDSTLSSVSKLFAKDLVSSPPSITKGRWVMIVITALGSLPLLLSPQIISATTISGTMVIGLTPVFLFWWWPAPPASFYASVLTGLGIGLIYTLNLWPSSYNLTTGPYADMFTLNAGGVVLCIIFYFLPILYQHYDRANS